VLPGVHESPPGAGRGNRTHTLLPEADLKSAPALCQSQAAPKSRVAQAAHAPKRCASALGQHHLDHLLQGAVPKLVARPAAKPAANTPIAGIFRAFPSDTPAASWPNFQKPRTHSPSARYGRSPEKAPFV